MEFWKFVEDHINDDVMKLRLKYHDPKDSLNFDVESAIIQIECRRKFGRKLAETLKANPHFVFPNVLAGEQSTSDLLAAYHSTLLEDGEKVVDLTAGLGIDCLHFLSKSCEVTAVEIDARKAECLKINSQWKTDVVCSDCRDFLSAIPDRAFDTTFIDPARRAMDGSRVYALEQCEPDVTTMLDRIFRCSHRLIIKMSPMLDITHTSEELGCVTRMIALGTKAECKELIAICKVDNDNHDEMPVEAVTIHPDGTIESFSFLKSEEMTAKPTFAEPKAGVYLYEPWPSVMKAAPYRLLSERYGINKLNPNTHLYTCDRMAEDFPGEISEIKEVLPYSSSVIKRLRRQYPKINVATRNFDIPADAVKRKLGVKDGGPLKLTATRTDRPILIITQKS